MPSTPTTTSQGHAADRQQRIARVVFDVARRRSEGERVSDASVLAAHPDLLPELQRELQKLSRIGRALELAEAGEYQTAWQRLEADWRAEQRGLVETDAGRPDPAGGDPLSLAPEQIGRYHIVGRLGEGGFGRVYLARDEDLQREVAVKIPHAREPDAGDPPTDEYLAEARVAAALDHPAIVPVYDVGRTDSGECYVVSKLVRGADLSTRMQQGPLLPGEAVPIAIQVAEALHHAHLHGLVHRDVKPNNILLDAANQPFVTDFGLALCGHEGGAERSFAGTPAYMSPEQARGEAHRVDGRSDVFSLGIVLYEMLTGHKPFCADNYDQLRDQIIWESPRPLQELNEQVDEQLERICFKALAKRASDRYDSARQMAADLRYWQRASGSDRSAEARTEPQSDDRPLASSAVPLPKIVPKGLRPFDAADADYYLPLVPGPRDRDGLPESIRQWTRRIEATAPEASFAVGLMYGPSGCGKSSLVRAGLLPRLTSRIRAVYLEATPEDTEERLRKRLGRGWQAIPADAPLADCLAEMRRGRFLADGEKLLIVIDQFEQWLHGKGNKQRRALLAALRQCDGVRVQCLLLVRDDFWLATSRFMAELEVDLVQGHNVALVDLFDLQHARNVLAELGRAYGRLPDDLRHIGAPEKGFLNRVVEALAEEDRVVPVRLALFAEMVKARQWKPITMREVGGAEGVGVTFLEETFCARTANPQHRRHQHAARAVLAALLPAHGSPIRSRIRSATELLDISGYANRPAEFRELLRILDSETRLLTPMDPDAFALAPHQHPPGERYYQLAHDYLVPSLQQWLAGKEHSSRRGRARLRLAERATLWNARRERRQLPSLVEWFSIRLLTRTSEWTVVQRDMMRAAARCYLQWLIVLAAVALTLLYSGVEVTAVARNVFMKLRAHSASVWLTLGLQEDVWPLLAASDDPTIRTEVIHNLQPLATGPDAVVAQLGNQEDPAIRAGMLLLAGELAGAPDELSPRQSELRRNEAFVADLQRMYRDEPDAGVHAAIRWTLQRLGLGSDMARWDEELKATIPRLSRQWFVTPRGHTMVIVPGPATFATPSERTLWIPRSYCIADTETTRAQFLRFLQDHPRLRARYRHTQPLNMAAPQTGVRWFDAAAYCNWLSATEGIPEQEWCYEPNAEGRYDVGMRIRPSFLERRGYRLPTEVEWEYACRAGSTTPYFFGRDRQYLPRYATCRANTQGGPTAAGTHKPNRLGLFDMLGNVAEWCQDAHLNKVGRWPPAAEASGHGGYRVSADQPRTVRGGSYQDPDDALRCAARASARPAMQSGTTGFRVARSYP